MRIHLTTILINKIRVDYCSACFFMHYVTEKVVLNKFFSFLITLRLISASIVEVHTKMYQIWFGGPVADAINCVKFVIIGLGCFD